MILVTGGCGVMGSVLVRRFHEAGETVRVLTLPGDPGVARVEEIADDIRFGDIANAGNLKGVCDGVDTVYHLAAVIIAFSDSLYDRINVQGTRNLVREAVRAGVDQFVYVSSASVVYPKPTPYSLSKRVCEKIVRESGLGFTVIRPTLVYDKGAGAQEFDLFLEYLKQFPLVPFIGSGRALKRPVFVDDVIDGLVRVRGNKAARGKTYNFSGGEAVSMIEFARLCLKLLGLAGKPVLHIPVWVCSLLARGMARFMEHPPLRWPVIAGVTQDADLDPAEAMTDLGYDPVCVSRMLPSCFPRTE